MEHSQALLIVNSFLWLRLSEILLHEVSRVGVVQGRVP